jgi:hypothetical protein
MPLSYRDMEWLVLHRADPPPWEQPEFFPDEAPVPIWLVPPAHRAARVHDLVAAIGDGAGSQEPLLGEQLLERLPGWLSQLGVPWDEQEGLRWWSCPSGPLVVWRRRRRKVEAALKQGS